MTPDQPRSSLDLGGEDKKVPDRADLPTETAPPPKRAPTVRLEFGEAAPDREAASGVEPPDAGSALPVQDATLDKDEFLPPGLPALPPPVLEPEPVRDEKGDTAVTAESTAPVGGPPAPAAVPEEPLPPPASQVPPPVAAEAAGPDQAAPPSSGEAEQPPQQEVAPTPAQLPPQEVLISRENPPRLSALLFPTTVFFVLPYCLLAVAAETGILDLGRWRIAVASGAAIGLWLMIFRLLLSAWRYPDLLPDWFIDFFNAVTRRTGITVVDRTGFATCVGLTILSLFVSPWVAWLCAAGALGFGGSLRQPVVLWPVGWEPLQPSAPAAPEIASDAVVRQSFEWTLERGLGIRRQMPGKFTLVIDRASYEMLAAENPRQAGDELGWRTRAEWLVTRGSTEEVIRVALALYQMRKDERLTDYEDVANALSFIHQCFELEEQPRPYWRTPLETLQDRRGTSADLSLLFAAVLRQLGRPCLLLYNAKRMHMAVAVAGASGFPRNLGFVPSDGGDYFYCETIQRDWMPGEVPSGVNLQDYQRFAVPLLPAEDGGPEAFPVADIRPRTPPPSPEPVEPSAEKG